MKLNTIIESIAQCHSYATALQTVAIIAVSPGEPGDIAAMMQAAKRLNDQLAAIQRLVTRELNAVRVSNPKTAIMSEDNIFDMLATSVNN